MRVPIFMGVLALVGVACTDLPPAPRPVDLRTAAMPTGMTLPPTVTPPAGMPTQPSVSFWPWVSWPGSGGITQRPVGNAYALTQFTGPNRVPTGAISLKAGGGAYDSCTTDYAVKASVPAGRQEIHLSVTASKSNRQCFASGYEAAHTFDFPVQVDQPGQYTVKGMDVRGLYQSLGTVTVTGGPTEMVGPYVYEFDRYDGPGTAKTGQNIAIKASGGQYDFCDYSFAASCQVDAAAKIVRLSLSGTPLPENQVRCMAMAANHTKSFDATFTTQGMYQVQARTATGWNMLGSIIAH
ncbi:MAG: hypothetical protein H7338_24605 [Candidatus Sericytochromatia bacterium]|nr:hypothetical protein [Candidatus Sericytochromatia bacterium]